VSIAEANDRHRQRPLLVPPRPAPRPDTMSTIRRMAAVRRSGIDGWGKAAYEEDIVKGRFLGQNNFIVNAPDGIRHVLIENYENYTRTAIGIRVLRPILGSEGLLLSEGKAWKHQRRTLAPAFSPRAVSMLVPHMHAAIDDAIAGMNKQIGEVVDLREAMQRLTLDIAGRTMFSFSIDKFGPQLRAFVMEYGTQLAQPYPLDLLLPLSWPSPQDFKRRRFRKRWTDFISKLIEERRQLKSADGAPRDLFDLMVEARDPETGEAFNDVQLGDQVSTMILAGHETTATALFWALYLLALDPATQDEVAREALEVVASGEFAVEKLKFTRAVLDETMRLYPPAFLIARAAAAPDVIAGKPVQKGDIVLISPWILHRHEKLWREPNAFDPNRFLTGTPPDRFAYLPFGVGPRVCIGAHFALVEATLSLARLIASFRVELRSNEPVMPIGVVTTQPDHAPPFALSKRAH
jgi:cytochrome P450